MNQHKKNASKIPCKFDLFCTDPLCPFMHNFQSKVGSSSTMPCKYFAKGCCNDGKKCRFSHDISQCSAVKPAPAPPTKNITTVKTKEQELKNPLSESIKAQNLATKIKESPISLSQSEPICIDDSQVKEIINPAENPTSPKRKLKNAQELYSSKRSKLPN